MTSFQPLYTGVVDFTQAAQQLTVGKLIKILHQSPDADRPPVAAPPIRIQGDRYGPQPYRHT